MPATSKESGLQNTDELQRIKEEIGGEKVTDVNVLFLDISSTCTGYAIATVDFINKKANVTKAGCLWFGNDWGHQERYLYMFEALQNYFWIVEHVDYIIVEQYSVNPKKLMGINVVSEMQGAIKAGAWSNGVKVDSILPQSWRSVLKIKPTLGKNGAGKTIRDFKGPTKDRVLERVAVPEEVLSNISGEARKTPSDVYDALAIGLAWLERFGIKTITSSNVKFNGHIGVLNK